MIEQTSRKALDEEKAAMLNDRFEREWNPIREKLQAVMWPTAQIRDAMSTAGFQLTGRVLGIKPAYCREAVLHSRFIRDHWTMLNMAGDSGRLESFAARCEEPSH
jgi:glycerol-1-phosphate dehydrogenase [NAD(P)+]